MHRNIHFWVKSLVVCAGLLALAGQPLIAQQQQQRGNQGGGNRNGGQSRATSGGSGSATTRQYYSNGTVGDAVVTSDPETRRLIVITDEETSQYIGQVITNLDKPKPQVLINVVFLEVTHDKNLDVGVEGSYSKKIDSTTTVGLTNGFGLLSQGVANSWGTPGAGMYSIAGKDFAVSLRAIAESGKMEVLSRPSILARNNQQATILVGQQIPIVSNVRYDVNGGQINTVVYQDVGIILKVTPFITSDGMVEMIVAPEISALDKTQSIAISKDVSAPIINKRSADTVVVTPDGQPVIIGGLMQNTKSDTESRVPILGDIPGLGYLFKRKAKGNTKTELMIFLTPHIIQQPSQLASMTAREKAAGELAPNAFTEEQLNRYLNSTPAPKPAVKAPKAGKRN